MTMEKYRIEHETTNEEIINYLVGQLKIGEKKEDIIEKVLSVGVAVIERVQSSRDLEFVKKETEKLMTEFQNGVTTLESNIQKNVETQISKYFNPDIDGSYSKKFLNFLREKAVAFQKEIEPLINGAKEQSKLLIDNSSTVSNQKLSAIETGIKEAEKNFNPDLETSYFGRLKSIISGVESKLNLQLNDQQTDSFAHKLKLDAEKHFGKESPVIQSINGIIETYSKQVTTEINGLRDLISKEEGKKEGVLELFDKSAMKGASFEDEALERLEELAQPFSDVVEYKGNTPEIGTQSKKGDYLYQLKEGPKFVIETKDQESLSLKAAIDYLDNAMKLRGVDYGIFIFKKESQLPKAVGSFGFYNNNKLVTSYSNLDIALRWTRIFLTKVENKYVEGVNKAEVLEKLKNIQTKLKEITTAKTKLTQIQTAVESNTESIRTILDNLKSDIEKYVSDIESEFNKTEESTDNNGTSGLFDIQELQFAATTDTRDELPF